MALLGVPFSPLLATTRPPEELDDRVVLARGGRLLAAWIAMLVPPGDPEPPGALSFRHSPALTISTEHVGEHGHEEHGIPHP
jgi:hypothetical protein